MADSKLSGLTAITNSELVSTDLMLISDTSATQSKSITISELDLRYKNPVNEYSSAQTLNGDQHVVICDTSSAAFQITLPAAASYTGKQYKIVKKKGLTDFNKLTISDGGSFSTFLYGAGEGVTVVSDGSSWSDIDYSPSSTMTYAPTITNCSNIVTNSSRIKFHRKTMEVVNGGFILNGAGTTAAAITLSVPFATIDTSKLFNGTDTSNAGATILGGMATWFDSGNAWLYAIPRYKSTTTFGFAVSTQELFGNQLASGDSVQYAGIKIPIAT